MSFEFVIDRPKGYKKTFHTEKGPIDVTYPLDYGYIKGLSNPEDNEDLDVFVGSDPANSGLCGKYMKGKYVNGRWAPDEHKYYLGMKPAELLTMLKFWDNMDPGLIKNHVRFNDFSEFVTDAKKQCGVNDAVAQG